MTLGSGPGQLRLLDEDFEILPPDGRDDRTASPFGIRVCDGWFELVARGSAGAERVRAAVAGGEDHPGRAVRRCPTTFFGGPTVQYVVVATVDLPSGGEKTYFLPEGSHRSVWDVLRAAGGATPS